MENVLISLKRQIPRFRI